MANYLHNQIRKETGAFKIGIFTVFLTVMVITFLESVLSCTPVLFVKFGQKAAGAIDYTMRSNTTASLTGNVNFYNVDPFNNPLRPVVASSATKTTLVPSNDDTCNPCNPKCYDATGCQEW